MFRVGHELGMAGAAWATIIGQAVTMIVAVIFFLVKRADFACRNCGSYAGFGKMS